MPIEYNELDGDLITLAQEGKFNVITHGCNCMCTMGAGIAPQMAKAFGCDQFNLEDPIYKGDINKLGQIEVNVLYDEKGNEMAVVNAYTQYNYGRNHKDGDEIPFNYAAFTLCMKKINHIFKGKHIGLPYVIGCGLAGGDIGTVLGIIKKELCDMKVTMVKLPK